jgi:hypothetical protein
MVSNILKEHPASAFWAEDSTYSMKKDWSSVLKMDDIGSSKMLVVIYLRTQCHIREDSNVHKH